MHRFDRWLKIIDNLALVQRESLHPCQPIHQIDKVPVVNDDGAEGHTLQQVNIVHLHQLNNGELLRVDDHVTYGELVEDTCRDVSRVLQCAKVDAVPQLIRVRELLEEVTHGDDTVENVFGVEEGETVYDGFDG